MVSNREPWMHVRRSGRIEALRPASGLVSALGPVIRACSGTWIAHGAGSADRDTVDRHDRVPMPPDRPTYRLRRVWLSAKEEAGYYDGFANAGLWPLCHAAGVQPLFRAADWTHYQAVNRRFADAVEEEAGSETPVVLVQDYHLALLPRLLRQRMPQATIIAFWHVPWPSVEALAACPWREPIVQGLLGASVLGFQARSHCEGFLDAASDCTNATVRRAAGVANHEGRATEVRHYPASIEWLPAAMTKQAPVAVARARIRAALGLEARVHLGIGIDRLDATKGLPERFAAIERLLEREPRWIGSFAFVQVAAPSREGAGHTHGLASRLRADAARINARFGSSTWRPIVLNTEVQTPERVFEYYRAADLCFVSSLHDGMNLVAKEFVAARDDERGVLVLSRFAGAAHELPQALIVDPRDTTQCAAALHAALTMAPAEQRERMRAMRRTVENFDACRWAGSMLLDAAPLPALDAGCALFLDVDGTLLEFAAHPRAVQVAPALLQLLERLHERFDGALALVSGRALADLDRLFAPLVLPAAGQHGAELRLPGGRRVSHAPAMADDVVAGLRRLAAAQPGLLLEDKGGSIALHYRMAPQLEDLALHAAQEAAGRLGERWEVQAGKFVCELRPRGYGKGGAIRELMAQAPFAGRRPVFVGDDETDEDGFDAVNALGGQTIKVGPGDTRALRRVADVNAVLAWLGARAPHCRTRRARTSLAQTGLGWPCTSAAFGDR